MGAWRSRAHVGVRAAAAVAAICLFTADRGIAGTLLDGFREEVVWSGLSLPTAMAFAPDGRVYVAEKSGLVKVYASLSDPTPDIVADLRANVHDFWDRGLLGIAVDPEFPARPFIYVLYTWNRDLQDPASADPRWPDSCPNPPGDTNDGCVVDGRLARLELDGNGALVAERVLLEGRWCQQYPSHSIGALAFDDDERVLYVSAGDGASFNWVDYGQGGGDAGSPIPTNPCGDPPSGRGGAQSAPLAEGGALRSQDIRTSGDPVGLNGTILRLDPDTGAAAAGNPLQGGDPGDDMIIAYGLRNPFRFALRPGTNELYAGDVGWNNFEEINRVADATDAVVENFGWPCYEGPNRQNGYDAADLALCENLYVDAVAPATPPFFAYQHGGRVQLAQDPLGCAKTGSSSVSGVAFPAPGPYPSRFDGALYFSDYSRDCVFVMEPGPDGRPDPATRRTLIDAAANPVFLAAGPDGHIYYIDIDAGRILRVAYAEENDPPVARVDATPANGPAPLSVSFDGSLSSDPDPLDTITHRWDLDGDGSFDDATGATASWVYLTPGVYQAALQVEDDSGATNVAVVPITAGNTAPVPAILEPSSSYLWRAGEEIVFRGEATDPENGTLPPASLRWRINLQHCHDGPDDCHTHPLIEQDGVQEGSFTAPDHEYYSYLEITLTATDLGIPGQSGGVLSSSTTIALDPLTTTLSLRSEPPGLKLTFYDHTHASPLDETVIVDSTNTISAPSPQDRGGRAWTFVSWSNGGPRSHDVFVPEEGLSVTAAFSDSGVAGDWWDTEWPRRKRFQVRSQGLTEMLMNVPVLVTVDASTIEYGSIADDGADLRFVSHDGTPLAHEIEVWDETGTSRVWVRLPMIDPGGHHDHDTHFFAYYGNPDATDAQDAASVWSANYAGVWHLDPSLRDSSPHGHHLADNGTADALGAIGRGRTFNGTSWLDAGTSALLEATGALTIEAFVKIDDPNRGGSMRVVSKKQNWDSGHGYNLEYKPQENQLTNLSSGTDYGRAGGIDLDTNWHYLASTIDGTSARLFVDGVDRTTDPTCNALVASAQRLAIGRRSGGGDYWFGMLDEVRLSRVARTASWISVQQQSLSGTLVHGMPPESYCIASDGSCDGFDDDCDGAVDEDAAIPPAVAGLSVDRDRLSWESTNAAQGYDVARGDVAALRAVAGDFGAAGANCLANDLVSSSLDEPQQPQAGSAFWYLVRATNCAGAGTYDGAVGQGGSRDAGLTLGGAACP